MVRLDDAPWQRILRILPRLVLKPVIKLINKPADITIYTCLLYTSDAADE